MPILVLTGRTRVEERVLAERGVEAVLTLAVSLAGVHDGLSPANSHQELLRRLGLGIARAIFEAAGGTLTVDHGVEALTVEVRLLRREGRSEERQSEALGVSG
jgi:hypothetical protein